MSETTSFEPHGRLGNKDVANDIKEIVIIDITTAVPPEMAITTKFEVQKNVASDIRCQLVSRWNHRCRARHLMNSRYRQYYDA